MTLNSTPFVPPKQVVLLEVENSDCCGVQMLYRLENGLWNIGALKHGHGWLHDYPLLSTLYRLSTFDGELKEEDGLILEVQKYIRKGKENGKLFWDAFFHKDIRMVHKDIRMEGADGATEKSIMIFMKKQGEINN